MKETNGDLRVIRTRTSIKRALFELLEEKSFEAITIKDIATKAVINRATFYTHYQDKYDLMTQCEEELFYEMKTKILPRLPEVIAGLRSSDPDTIPFATLIPFFEFLSRNRTIARTLLEQQGNGSFREKLKNFMHQSLFENNDRAIFKPENLRVPPDYLLTYIVSAHLGVILEWLRKEEYESPHDITKIIATMTINGPFYAAGVKK